MLTKPITVAFTPPQQGQPDYMGVIDLYFDDADEVALVMHGSAEEAEGFREVLGHAPANVTVSLKDEDDNGLDHVWVVNDALTEPLPEPEPGKPLVIGRPFGERYPGEVDIWITRGMARKLAKLVGTEVVEV